MSFVDSLRVLVAMGLRNLAVHRVKSVVVGAIMFFGVFLVVLGTAMLDSVRDSMERSITSSLAGQAQVYSADAEDPLELFPTGAGGTMDYGEIDDFPALRAELLQVDNVKDVVPMGITNAIVFGSPAVDLALAELRQAVADGDQDAIDAYSAHVRAIAQGLESDVTQSLPMVANREETQADLDALAEVLKPAFWDGFMEDPDTALTTLDTTVAPLAMDGRMLYLRLLGTDLHQFAGTFESFELVEGELPPPGEPGILLARTFQEKQSKDKVARELDAIEKGLSEGKTIAEDPLLRLAAERLPRQVQGLIYGLPPSDGEVVRQQLAAALGDAGAGPDGSLRDQLRALLTIDDRTFSRHRDLFYEVVGPRIRLYETPVGESIVLRGFTKSGYQRAVEVKVYGIFTFSGLESSDLAGLNNLLDMGSFRSLYGRMSAAQKAELSDIRDSVGVQAIAREDAEAALFGGPPAEPAPPAGEDAAPDDAAADDAAPVGAATANAPADAASDAGLALNAAVIMDDPDRADQTIAAIKARIDAAGLDVVVVDWQQAAGFVGQIILVLQAILTVAILVIFLVALVIINNSMVMATMERTREIGTMRAIGAQRSFVIALFVLETIALGLLAGGLGAASAVGLVLWLGQAGIPAVADILVLLFAGPYLYPSVSPGNVALGMVAITAISLLSTLYPALLAARVQPVVAMQGKD